MSANVDAGGTVRQLDRRPEPDENVTAESVKDPRALARFLLRLFRDVSALKRRWMPQRMDFAGIVSTGTAMDPQTVYLDHNFGGPVVWWSVRAEGLGSGTGSLKHVEQTSETTENRLALSFMMEGTFTIRVEEGG